MSDKPDVFEDEHEPRERPIVWPVGMIPKPVVKHECPPENGGCMVPHYPSGQCCRRCSRCDRIIHPDNFDEECSLDAIIVPAPDVQAQIDAAVAREREACALEVEKARGFTPYGVELAAILAAAIRARSAQGGG